jgi:hypothetical protein
MAFVWTAKKKKGGKGRVRADYAPLRIILNKQQADSVFVSIDERTAREMMGDSNVLYYRIGVDMDARKIAMMAQRYPAPGWRRRVWGKAEDVRGYMRISINTMANFGVRPEELAPYNYPDFARDRDSGLYVALFRNRVLRGESTDEDA